MAQFRRFGNVKSYAHSKLKFKFVDVSDGKAVGCGQFRRSFFGQIASFSIAAACNGYKIGQSEASYPTILDDLIEHDAAFIAGFHVPSFFSFFNRRMARRLLK